MTGTLEVLSLWFLTGTCSPCQGGITSLGMEEHANLKCGFYRMTVLGTAVKLGMCKLNRHKPGTVGLCRGEVCCELLGHVVLKAEKAPHVPSVSWDRKACDTI